MSVDERANGAAPTGKRPFERRMLGRAATVYLVLLAIYAAASGRKLVHQSFAPHFVYQAHAWLRGRLSLPQPPPNQEDWARVETLTLSDGRILQGRFVGAGQFRHLDGSVHAIPAAPS